MSAVSPAATLIFPAPASLARLLLCRDALIAQLGPYLMLAHWRGHALRPILILHAVLSSADASTTPLGLHDSTLGNKDSLTWHWQTPCSVPFKGVGIEEFSKRKEGKEERKRQKGRSSLSLTSLYFFLSLSVCSLLVYLHPCIPLMWEFPKVCYSRKQRNDSQLRLSYPHNCFLALRP